jgi:acyl-coenzyme A thioesterase PaaI-like protein
MNDQTDVARLEADGWSAMTDKGFIELAGPFFFKKTSSGMSFCFPTGDKHHNRNGMVQGGALMTFTDRALGATAREMSGTARTATIQLNVQFVDGVNVGDIVEASPTVIRDTRHVIFMSTGLTVGDRTVAMATGVWKKLQSKPA